MPDLLELFSQSTQKAAPDPGALQRQQARQRRRSVGIKVGAFAVAAAIGAAAIAFLLVVRDDGGSTTPADEPSANTRSAEEVAISFLDAFGRFDAERAMTYVADDADLTGMGGYPDAESESLSMLASFLEAFGWEQTITTCEAFEAARPGDTTVVCTFDWHGLRSDEIARGPFTDSEFAITVRDSDIVEASWFWNVEEFSRQMWDPFAAWVSKTYPEDVEAMYENGQTDFRLSPESIRLWDRRSRQYVREVLRTS